MGQVPEDTTAAEPAAAPPPPAQPASEPPPPPAQPAGDPAAAAQSTDAGQAVEVQAEAPPPPELPDWTPEPIVKVWDAIQTYPILGAVIIVVLAFVAAKVTQVAIRKIVSRVTRRTTTDVDDKLIAELDRPIFLTVFLFGLSLAVRSLGLSAAFTFNTIRVLQTVLVLVWMGAGFRIFRLVLEVLSRLRERFQIIEERTIPLFDIVGKLIVLGGASYAALMIWDIDATAWLASAGVVGIAVGFAAKDTLANLFGGFFIVADAPYKLGDFVVLDSGERGMITHVGIRSTRMLTRDDIEITIPNAVMANAKIINETGGPHPKARIRVAVGVAYGSDVDRVCRVLEETAHAHPQICEEPSPRVRFRAFGDSSLDFELLCWIDEPVLRGKLLHEMHMEIYKAFAREEIEIPFPQRDVYVKHMAAPPGAAS